MEDSRISFVSSPGLILDRILTLSADQGREAAMAALTKVVREDVETKNREPGRSPVTLHWYVVGVRISGDPTFHVQPSFVDELSLSAHGQQLYRVHLAAIDAFRKRTGSAS
ncbi:hypothetical protein [Burkholderia ubonensis]|uniref:hypothetical protein n=1 Tax=Burkholderia ubonensis TaxID=101571 RepID=UPI001160A2F5|nr:hypothetical protein [Burkholderia ubonensis]